MSARQSFAACALFIIQSPEVAAFHSKRPTYLSEAGMQPDKRPLLLWHAPLSAADLLDSKGEENRLDEDEQQISIKSFELTEFGLRERDRQTALETAIFTQIKASANTLRMHAE
eukprot:2878699-Pleurochrysis_carterae.AAC.1